MENASKSPLPRLSVTSLSQYVRLENCERFLRFRLRPDEEKAFLRKWGLTIQPLTPLLRESGAEFERDTAARVAARGEQVVDLSKESSAATAQWLRQARQPVILLQPTLEAPLGIYMCNGRADILRLSRDRKGALQVLVADIKASRHERMEYRLQVAIYASLVQHMAAAQGLALREVKGTVLHIQEDGIPPMLDPDIGTFDLETYLTILDHLATATDSVISRIEAMPFHQVSYHLGYKCDGCMYNAICMFDSAERLDLSLVPYLSAVEKRVLHGAGIQTLPQLAALMTLPAQGSGERDLQVAPGQEAVVSALANQWPVGPALPTLVQRARRALRRFDSRIPSTTFLYNSGFGTLPSDEEHPNLVKLFLDAQHDYIQDRVYMISSLIAGPQGERLIVHSTDGPPTGESERKLLVAWVVDAISAMRQVAAAESAPVHLYCFNRYDQKVLLEALKRNMEQIAALPAFFDLMTQSPALTQPIISFLSEEIQERRNLGLVCTPLHDAARVLGFDWRDDQHEYFRLFRARLFDNRRDVVRTSTGTLALARDTASRDDPTRVTIEAASRFNSQIPLEYVYAAWHCLPKDLEDDRLLEPFRQVNLEQLKAFAGHRVRALVHIERSFRTKARGVPKPDVSLRGLLELPTSEPPLAQSIQEFLFMEHHAALQGKLLNYSLPIDRRAQTGLALLLRYEECRSAQHVYRFAIEFEAIGLDPVLTMNAFRLKEGDWVVINVANPPPSAGRIKGGRLAIIKGIGTSWLDLNLLDFSDWHSRFRYPHDRDLVPQPGQLYTLDEMADDMNADKALESLQHTDTNTLYRWLLARPAQRIPDQRAEREAGQFADLVDTVEQSRKLTLPQREVVAGHWADPLFLVQGPPGTGKSHTLAWAVLCRLATSAAQGKPCRIAVSCKTHNAIIVVLEALSQKWRRLTGFTVPMPGVKALQGLRMYKIVNEESDVVPPHVMPLKTYNAADRSWPAKLDELLAQRLIVVGGTPGGLYSLMKYRGAGGRAVDWSLKTFDVVVIDEASQMSLPEGVLACAFLKPEGSAIVVGDHRQMPPIIAHAWEEEEKRSAVAHQPYLSLFESLLKREFPRVALDESFRLHKVIADFLQENIYIHDGIRFFSRRQALLTVPPPIDPFVNAVLDPRYPVAVVEHDESGSQQYNETEVALIAPLIDVCANHLQLDGKDGIGIVVPHRAQKAMLRERFPDLAIMDSIDTVERFQGGERDVIIVSATASDPDYVLAEADFLLNLNRLNVALSRPRKKLIVVASRSVIDLLTSDLDVFENAVIWKRLYYQYAADVLWRGERHGVSIWLRGKRAG